MFVRWNPLSFTAESTHLQVFLVSHYGCFTSSFILLILQDTRLPSKVPSVLSPSYFSRNYICDVCQVWMWYCDGVFRKIRCDVDGVVACTLALVDMDTTLAYDGHQTWPVTLYLPTTIHTKHSNGASTEFRIVTTTNYYQPYISFTYNERTVYMFNLQLLYRMNTLINRWQEINVFITVTSNMLCMTQCVYLQYCGIVRCDTECGLRHPVE